MRKIISKILRTLIDTATRLLNKIRGTDSEELMTQDQKTIKKYEKKVRSLQAQIERNSSEKDKILQQRKSYEKKLRLGEKKLAQEKQISKENAVNPLWFEAQCSDSIKKQLEYYTFFAGRTWRQFETLAKGRTVLLFGIAKECKYFYDRYGEKNTLQINHQTESWNSIQELLEHIGTEDKVILITGKEWKILAYCLTDWQGNRDNLFVYSLMEYEQNEQKMMGMTWENLKEDVQKTNLVLVTANERAKEFIQKLSKDFPVQGILSAKKLEWGSFLENIQIAALDEAVSIFPPKTTTLVLCSVNWNEYINIFSGRGYRNIYSLRLLCRSKRNRESAYSRAYSKVMAMWGMPACEEQEQKEHIKTLLDLLADEDSRITVENVLNYRSTGQDRSVFILEEPEVEGDPLYFERRFLKLGTKETYLDIGIGNGQTIRDFIQRVHGRYEKIYAWEINPRFVKGAEKAFRDERITILPYGAWNEESTMFVNGAGAGAKVDNHGRTQVQCKRIDDICKYPVTFIKMDIEGAELKALEGAAETIKRYMPKLAISLYHKQNDIWEIPLYIHQLVPEYKLYIRHHKATPNDTVLYAVIE